MKKQPYIKPELEVFEYEVEHGYAASVYVHDNTVMDLYDPFTETRTESENWTVEDDEGFWTSSW